MELKSGLKQTEVGVIPEDWDVSSLSRITLKIQDGTHFSPKLGGNDFLYITSRNIRHGYIDLSKVDRIDTEQHKAIYKRCDVKYGDLLLTKDGASTGNAALNSIKEEFSLLSSVALLRFDPIKHDANYFLQQILSHAGQQRINEAMSGNAITRLTLDKINKLVYPVPPTKAEQNSIANALSDADALIQSLIRLIAKKRQIKQGAMQTLLNPYENGRLKEGWVVKKLGEIFEITAGGDLRKNEFSKTADENHQYPIYSNALTNCGLYGYCKSFDYSGSFITVTARGNVGFAVARNCTFVAIGRLLVLKPINDVNCQFVSEYINLRVEFANENTGVPQLTAPQILNYEIAIPSKNSEQIRIATILSGMDAEIAALEAKLAKYRHIKQGMMQNLLTGKIRLI